MKKKCYECKLVNFPDAEVCSRCGGHLGPERAGRVREGLPSFLRRFAVFLLVCAVSVAGFYFSLVMSARPLDLAQRKSVESAIGLLESKGFTNEVFLLRRLAVYRSEDNWLNASVEKENAFAATNFPFEIVTIYPDFFLYPADDVERAAILLHEAKHLEGADERAAYEFVWRSREKLGWTTESYRHSEILAQVRRQTRDAVPSLFVCDINPFGDCTERR